MLKQSLIIHERNNRIEIPKKMTSATETFSPDYSLKKNFFDPTKGSPPNDFMLKLQMRMSIYDYTSVDTATAIGVNADNRDKE
jgi:hypothetical protein